MATSLKSLCASNEGKYEKFVRQSVGKRNACGLVPLSVYACTSVHVYIELQMQCIMRCYIIHTPPITQCMYVEHPHHLPTCGAYAHWLRVSFLTGSCQDTVLLFNIILTLYQVSIVNLAS
jgi:hypothetical protein